MPVRWWMSLAMSSSHDRASPDTAMVSPLLGTAVREPLSAMISSTTATGITSTKEKNDDEFGTSPARFTT